jgi:hypothetical protein
MMIDTAAPASITGAELRAIRQRVFRARETTLDSEAAAYTLAELRATLESFRRMTRATLTDLSERAFDAQPAHDAGDDRWSAGQIVRHLAQVQIDVFLGPIRAANGLPAPSAEELGVPSGVGALTRADAIVALDIADRQLERCFAELPAALDLTAGVPDNPFGPVGAGGLLTIACIHEEDHWGQLNELR